jgi:starch-binding outer membrane protein, SusD/RagB family
LYKKDWTNASTYASEVITANDYYELNEDVLSVFRKNSRETIWEIASDDEANTNEGDAFIIEDGFSSASVQIKAELLEAFEDQDARQNWIGTYTDPGTGTGIYFPYKYRERYYNSPAENFVILRLGEQYLIRAEAEAALGNKQESLADLDSIRARAAVPALSPSQGSISDQDLQDLIMHERRVELFAEWGHRWFDLKRWDLANSVLSVKTGWTEDDMLYPVPASEFKANPKLGQQNDGY